MRIVLKFYRVGNAVICEPLCTDGVPDEQSRMAMDDDGYRICAGSMDWDTDLTLTLADPPDAQCACHAYGCAQEAQEAIRHFVALVAQLNRRDGDGNAGMDVSLAH